MSVWNEKKAKELFQELPFYNALIEKPSIELLHELTFFDKLSVVEISKAF